MGHRRASAGSPRRPIQPRRGPGREGALNLGDLQAAFVDCLWGSRRPAELFPLLRTRGPAALPERVRVYEGDLGRRAVDRLRRAFPVCARLLGPRAFEAAALEHLRRLHGGQAPRPDLIRAWPAFLAIVPHLVRRADASQLAELELARADVGMAEDRSTAEIADLRRFRPDELPELRLELIAALAVLPTSFEVARLWAAARRGARPRLRRASRDILVWRRRAKIFHAAMRPAEAAALRAARAGAALATVCDAFAGERQPGQAAHATIVGWFADGLVASILPPAA